MRQHLIRSAILYQPICRAFQADMRRGHHVFRDFMAVNWLPAGNVRTPCSTNFVGSTRQHDLAYHFDGPDSKATIIAGRSNCQTAHITPLMASRYRVAHQISNAVSEMFSGVRMLAAGLCTADSAAVRCRRRPILQRVGGLWSRLGLLTSTFTGVRR